MTRSRLCIGVIFGGESGEHNVSIESARTVIQALKNESNSNRFEVTEIYIDTKGKWWPATIANQVLNNKYTLSEEKINSNSIDSKGFKSLPEGCEKIDIWFPVLHGPNGEDGTLQGLLKLTGKPFVGSDVLGSAIGMDKLAMKSIFKGEGLPQLPYIPVLKNEMNENNLIKIVQNIEERLTYPCFIKPANLGSSVGISKANNRDELIDGLHNAAHFDKRIVVEQGIVCRELECGVIGSHEAKASEVGEIRFDGDWYDYETKYLQGSSHLLVPAPIPSKINRIIQKMSLIAFKAIAANGLARVDFFYNETNDDLWINEINTLPGFTSKSMFPVLWQASGVTLEHLVAKLVDIARE